MEVVMIPQEGPLGLEDGGRDVRERGWGMVDE